MQKIVFDIETAGMNWDVLDKHTQDHLIKKFLQNNKNSPVTAFSGTPPQAGEKPVSEIIQEIQKKSPLSPYLGKVITICLYNPDTKKGAIYFNTEEDTNVTKEQFLERAIEVNPNTEIITGSEAQILAKFWSIISSYSEVITFYGSKFDIPFLMIRAAIHNIQSSMNLLKPYGEGIDLAEALGFYGKFERPSLHIACHAFSIPSPKDDLDGAQVPEAYRNKEYVRIATYCLKDVIATAQLYEKWSSYLRFPYQEKKW